MKPPRGEEGYALVAAVASIAVFAMMSLTVMAATRASIVQGTAEYERARADAAADAGVAIALQGLLNEDRAFRWSIDGRPRAMSFADSQLVVRVEDERGKVSLNALEDDQVRHLFEALGVSGDRLSIVTDSFLDWLDDDDEVRENGAELEYYTPRDIRPRNGPPQSIDELTLVRGFDPALVAKLREIATLNFGSGGFDPRFANPVALAVFSEGGEDSPAVIDRKRELAGQRPAIELGEDIFLVGRPLSIVATATTPGGGRAEHRMIVQLTGIRQRPYLVSEYR